MGNDKRDANNCPHASLKCLISCKRNILL